MTTAQPDPRETRVERIAQEVLSLLGTERQAQPFSQRGGAAGTAGDYSGFDVEEANRVAVQLRSLRQARGERMVGRKLGYTNRKVWAEVGMAEPVWAPLYDTSVREMGSDPGAPELTFALSGLAQPRIEPEIVFGLRRAPQPGMTGAALLECVDWIAPGFEMVQSIYPDWRAAPPDIIATGCMHAALLVGPKQRPGTNAAAWVEPFATFEVELSCGGAVRERGQAANVLEGPLSALGYLAALLAKDPSAPPLAAGEVITTGSLCTPPRVAAGEQWSVRLIGLPLAEFAVRLA